MFGEAEEVADLADLQHDEVPGGEHVVEIVRVDPEQDRGHSSTGPGPAKRWSPGCVNTAGKLRLKW